MAKTHGLSGTPEWQIWRGMIQRCRDPNHKAFPNYGGRGIAVSPKWEDFPAFLSDMGPRPDGMTLGRIDNDGPYVSGNCRWESMEQQNSNRRCTRNITANGRTQTVSQWARELGVKPPTLLYRIRAGWTPEMVVDPVIHHGLRRI